MCVVLSLVMSVVESPLYIGASVLVLSLFGAFILSKARTWFSLILFLIYVGGMLVSFAYFLALCPNQSVTFSFLLGLPVIIAEPFLFVAYTPPVVNRVEVVDLYIDLNQACFVFSVFVLFIAMVRVVKIVRRRSGALRPFHGGFGV